MNITLFLIGGVYLDPRQVEAVAPDKHGCVVYLISGNSVLIHDLTAQQVMEEIVAFVARSRAAVSRGK